MPINLADIKPSRCTGTYQDEYMDDDGWTLEEKYDGARYVALFEDDGTPRLYSRYRFPAIEKAHLVPMIFQTTPELAGTVLDGEMLSPTTPPLSGVVSWMGSKNPAGSCPLWYVAFDCLFFKGQDIRHLPLAQRREYMHQAVEVLQHLVGFRYIICADRAGNGELSVDKNAFLKRILDRSGEGGVLKHLGSRYGLNWVKIKKRFDFSTVITGFQPGKGKYASTLGSILVSVYKDGKLVEVGKCSGMTDAERVAIWDNQAAYLGKVLDVFAQEITKDGRLRHPVFHRYRDDIQPTNCTWEKLHDDAKAAKAQAKAKGLTSEG